MNNFIIIAKVIIGLSWVLILIGSLFFFDNLTIKQKIMLLVFSISTLFMLFYSRNRLLSILFSTAELLLVVGLFIYNLIYFPHMLLLLCCILVVMINLCFKK